VPFVPNVVRALAQVAVVTFAIVATEAAEQRTVPGAGLAAVVDVSVKVTVPVGWSDPAVWTGDTVAVKVTSTLAEEGLLGEEPTVTVVESFETDCGTALEAGLLRKLFVFELVNVAVSEWLPGEVNATTQAGTTPPVNVLGEPVLPKVQSGVGVVLSL
jgi:hypothetical protein